MANERLRTALLQRGVTPAQLADAAGVDPKTVERWIGGRIPYRRHRYLVATHLQADETYLWPDALAPADVADASESEILTVYPHRWAVPRDGWGNLFSAAEQEIGVLVYSGLFLADDTGMHALLTRKASEGVSVRFLLGDPDSPHVDTRGQDEGINEAMAAKIRNVLVLYRELRDIIFYTSDGEARQEFAVLFTARPTGGTPTPSGESREVLWMPRDQILSLNMDRSMRMRVQHYLDACPQPYLG